MGLRAEGGMCNEMKMPPLGFQLSKPQTQMCGRMVCLCSTTEEECQLADCAFKTKLGRTVGC